MHSFNKYLLRAYFKASTIAGTRDTVMKKTKVSAFPEFTFQWKQGDDKQVHT